MAATATDAPVRLNIGAGPTQIEGFTPIDRKNGQEAYPLDYPDNSVEEIRASHILEHFPHSQVDAVLADWYRVLKPGGTIWIAVPNILRIAENAAEDNGMWEQHAMGGQVDENDYHMAAFTPRRLEERMARAGFVEVEEWNCNAGDTACSPISLNRKAMKPGEGAESASPFNQPKMEQHVITANVHAVLACPRLIFSDMIFCASHYCAMRQIPLTKSTGCFWEKQIDKAISEAIDNGADWILTLDYDSVFTPNMPDRLLYLMHTHPEADAIAPLQMKREHETPMIWQEPDPENGRVEFEFSKDDPDLTKIDSAHFGMTLLRVEAIKKMPRPWFQSLPNGEGRWDEGQTDGDIYFWRKFKEAGNQLYLANHVSIGHLQMVATWPGADFKPLHQYAQDFHENGAPKGIRT